MHVMNLKRGSVAIVKLAFSAPVLLEMRIPCFARVVWNACRCQTCFISISAASLTNEKHGQFNLRCRKAWEMVCKPIRKLFSILRSPHANFMGFLNPSQREASLNPSHKQACFEQPRNRHFHNKEVLQENQFLSSALKLSRVKPQVWGYVARRLWPHASCTDEEPGVLVSRWINVRSWLYKQSTGTAAWLSYL